MTPKVSDEQLLADIKQTEIEVRAYHQLFEGYNALSWLPENKGAGGMVYRTRARNNARLETECQSFLNKLLAMRQERGI